ncbi:MAG: aminotransferase class III-fold pyridoxal phosphate-dependent enzyme [Steroidobacteraceae bacterium]
MTAESLLERRYRVLGRNSPLFYDRPLHLVRGEGVWLWDAEGNRYLDAYNNVPHVGHSHPHVVEAMARQAALLNIHTRYLHEGVVSYAERLTRTFDPDLSMLMLTCSGSEANELALRIANVTTGGKGVICTNCSYHGNTVAVAQISTMFTPPEGFGPHIRAVDPPDSYRGIDGLTGQALEDAYVARIEGAIESLNAQGIRLAAMLICTMYSSEGLPIVPAGFMPRAVAAVHKAGGLFIADEVQGGFGRTGQHMWGHQRFGVTPDLVTLGKPMGNGHPVAGVVGRADLVQGFRDRVMYFNTFAGNPVSCAAANAVLDVLESEQLQANAVAIGSYLAGGLRELATRHEAIGDVRSLGMFFAVDLVDDRERKTPASALAKRVINGMCERGVLISRIGPHDNVLKIRPPMPFGRAHADQLLATLDEVLAAG